MTEDFGTIVGALALNPILIPILPEKLSVLNVSLKQFAETTSEIVIPNFEGGYYHQSMKKNFKLSDQKKLGDSGETLFGLDRKHGSQLAKYQEWAQFWKLVDSDRAKNPALWKYNYKPSGELGKELRRLASEIMYKWFNYLAGKYILISSMDEIADDQRLLIHFSYASWNGEGWFQRYAKALNEAIQKHPGDREKIFSETIKARTDSANKVIRQQGAHMMEVFKKLGLMNQAKVKSIAA